MIGHDIHHDMVECVAEIYKHKSLPDMTDSLLEHIQSTPLTSMSTKAVEDKTKQTHVGEKILTVAAAVLEWSYFLWGLFLSYIYGLCTAGSQPPYQPILFMLKLRYDETPGKVRVSSSVVGGDAKGKSKGSKKGIPIGSELHDKYYEGMTLEDLAKAIPANQSSDRAKIFQSELSLGCLLKPTSPGDRLTYKWLSGSLPTALQSLEDGTGESIRAALFDTVRKIPELERVSSLFPLVLRHSCSDRYTGNFTAENLLKNLPSFELSHFTCDVHRLYSVITTATSCMDYDVSGILSIGTGISPDVGCVQTMRQILMRILTNKLVIYYEAPPASVATYRDHLFSLFLPVKRRPYQQKQESAKQTLLRRWVISYFLNGDLSGCEIQHFCQYSCCDSPSATMRSMSLFLTWALLPHKCPKFARSRWTGWIESIQWTGLLAGCHNLLMHIILEYTGGPTQGPTTQEEAVPENQQTIPLDGGDAGADFWDDLFQQEANVAAGGVSTSAPPLSNQNKGGMDGGMDGGVGAGTGDAVPPESETTKQAFDWAELNRKQRGNARNWVQSNPLPRLVLLQEVCSLLMSLMYKFLALGGHPWERKQQSKVAKGLKRDYAVCIAAEGKDVQTTMEQLQALFFSPAPAIPGPMITPLLKTMRFRQISSSLCSLHVLLRAPRDRFPFLLFKVLLGHIDAAVTLPECLWDPLTHLLRSRYASRFNHSNHFDIFLVRGQYFCTFTDAGTLQL